MVLNMGPQHPSTHGVLRVVLELDGETIVRRRTRNWLSAYRHRKILRSANIFAGHHAYRPDGLSRAAFEQSGLLPGGGKILGLEVPKRAQYIRVLLTEITRIASHLVWIGTHAIDIGAMSVFLYCFREREEVMKIFEMVSGQRMMTSYFRIGGLALEPPTGWLDRVKRFLDMMPSRAGLNTKICSRKIASGWRARKASAIIGVGRRDCAGSSAVRRCARLAWPTMSASIFRIRATMNSISTCRRSTEGDCYARYMLRVAEIRESLKIVQQAMAEDSPPRARFAPTRRELCRRSARK